MENKYYRNIRKEDFDIEMVIRSQKWNLLQLNTKKIVIIIDFNGEMVDLFAPKCFDSKAVDFEKKLNKLDKVTNLKVIGRKNKDSINYLNIDIELSTKY